MSFPFSVPDEDDLRGTVRSGVLVRRSEGIHRWLAGDTYTIKVTADDTHGALGFAEATVPPGGGPVGLRPWRWCTGFHLIRGFDPRVGCGA